MSLSRIANYLLIALFILLFFFSYRMCIAVKRDNYPIDTGQTLPAHTIMIMAPITLTNLLPYELLYEAGIESGRIRPGSNADLHCPNIDEQLEIIIHLEGYPGTGTVCKLF